MWCSCFKEVEDWFLSRDPSDLEWSRCGGQNSVVFQNKTFFFFLFLCCLAPTLWGRLETGDHCCKTLRKSISAYKDIHSSTFQCELTVLQLRRRSAAPQGGRWNCSDWSQWFLFEVTLLSSSDRSAFALDPCWVGQRLQINLLQVWNLKVCRCSTNPSNKVSSASWRSCFDLHGGTLVLLRLNWIMRTNMFTATLDSVCSCSVWSWRWNIVTVSITVSTPNRLKKFCFKTVNVSMNLSEKTHPMCSRKYTSGMYKHHRRSDKMSLRSIKQWINWVYEMTLVSKLPSHKNIRDNEQLKPQ